MPPLEKDILANMLMLFLLSHPSTAIERIFALWNRLPTFKDYCRPCKKEYMPIALSVKKTLTDFNIGWPPWENNVT